MRCIENFVICSFLRVVCNEGYKLNGTDKIRCANGTIIPSTRELKCSPILCNVIKPPKFGHAFGTDPPHYHQFIIAFSCISTHWRDGPSQAVCLKGKWEPPDMPQCKPKPCTAVQCLNGGTCSNIDNHRFKCSCTHEWRGDTCERHTVHKDKLIRRVKQLVTDNGGHCKPGQLKNSLTGNIHGYPSYMWLALCHKKGDGSSHAMDSSQIIHVDYSSFELFVGWQDKFSPAGIVSRYTRGTTKVSQNLSNLVINCDANKVLEKMKGELAKLKLDYLMAMATIKGIVTFSQTHSTIISGEGTVTCKPPRRFGLAGSRIPASRKKMTVIIMGARERI